MTQPDSGTDKKNGSTRRTVLRGAGLLLLAGAGATVWRGVDRGAFVAAEGPPYEAWDLVSDPALRGTPTALAAAGILAANAHNTQPWIFEIKSDTITVYADLSRHLGSFDPFVREMHLSLGCALENIGQAAPAHGFTATIEREPGTLTQITAREGRRRVARVRLAALDTSPITGQDPIARLARRHTDRGPYDSERGVPDEILAVFQGLNADLPDTQLYFFTDGPMRVGFDRLTVAATERIIADTRMVQDSDRWFRLTKDEIAKHRDGPTIDASGLPGSIRALAKLMPRLSPDQAHASWLAATRDVQLPTAQVTGFIAVRDLYDQAQTLAAGQLWQRLHLDAVARGLSMHPVNQAVEVVDRERELGSPARMAEDLADLLGTRIWRPTFAFRAGYPSQPALPSPRRALDTVIV